MLDLVKNEDYDIKNKYEHIYSRGVNKCDIFHDELDYSRFQKSIVQFNSIENRRFEDMHMIDPEDKLVEIYDYVLMPNHFHIIAKELKQGGISLFMQKILSGYSVYFNYKYERTGSLFGSNFKSKIVDDEDYFNTLERYIYNNPLKIIHPHYTSKMLLDGSFKISKSDEEFLAKYPYRKIIRGPF